MWLNFPGVTRAQLVLLIERLDVTYFPADCLQPASRSKLQSLLIGCISKPCPRCTWAVFSMCHSFLLSWHFHLVISDGLRQAKGSRCSCAWCVPPREPKYKWSSHLSPSQSMQQRNLQVSCQVRRGKNTPSKDRWTYMNYVIYIPTENILNFNVVTHQRLFMAHCLKRLSSQKRLRKYPH